MAIVKSGSARYEGLGKDGKGHVSTQSGALDNQPYGFQTRFEDKAGTNPEELIAAAHASCFTMALSFKLAEAGHTDGSIETDAKVSLEKDDGGFTVTRSALSTKAKVPGLDKAKFEELAADAKATCPISNTPTACCSAHGMPSRTRNGAATGCRSRPRRSNGSPRRAWCWSAPTHPRSIRRNRRRWPRTRWC